MADESTGLSPIVPLGFLGLIVLTASWSGSISNFLRGSKPSEAAAGAVETKDSKKKGGKGKKEEKVEPVAPPSSDSSAGDKRRVLILVASWLLFFVYLASGYGFGDIGGAPFDPYKILNITQAATKSEIKKVYRTLSMDYHPDRLAGKPADERVKAEAHFVQISKAYKTLTDEQAMKNWVEYGHPDGPRTTTISFGIPAWMTKEENAGFVLLMYLGFFAAVGYFLKQKFIDSFMDEPEAASTETSKKKNT